MPANSPNTPDVKQLPGGAAPPPDALARQSNGPMRPGDGSPVVSGVSPPRQLSELPKDELEHLAEEFGLNPSDYKERQDLVSAIHDRRQLIAGFDRDAMLDVIRWGRRPVTASATREQIAQEIARIRTMRFSGLSQRGLVVLAKMRGIPALESDTVPTLVKRLKKGEGLFQKLSRKRRAFLGGMIAGMIGDTESAADYQFLPDPTSPGVAPARTATIKEDIEESGLIGGITNRIKKSADSYLNQKLDEIEARIDRKLDEIDRRLAEWRDKEIANRIRILKFTLWASVIVGVFSLIYSYVKVVFFPEPGPHTNPPAHVQPQSPVPPPH
ncbi:MAG: hypothetical protein JWL69_3881 [Phycisphaerales bacterium]|nr:hypothetical protein [Phycisphaerales bacterium]MDB5354737.1 hypothetical protein [Phycisphaerales bacterium]